MEIDLDCFGVCSFAVLYGFNVFKLNFFPSTE